MFMKLSSKSGPKMLLHDECKSVGVFFRRVPPYSLSYSNDITDQFYEGKYWQQSSQLLRFPQYTYLDGGRKFNIVIKERYKEKEENLNLLSPVL